MKASGGVGGSQCVQPQTYALELGLLQGQHIYNVNRCFAASLGNAANFYDVEHLSAPLEVLQSPTKGAVQSMLQTSKKGECA
eukprot:4476362-Amphidinium_carterae.3